MTVYLSTYLHFYLLVSLSISLYLLNYLSICLFVHLSAYLSICLSVCLYLFIHILIQLSTYLFTYVSDSYISICRVYLPPYLYLSLCFFSFPSSPLSTSKQTDFLILIKSNKREREKIVENFPARLLFPGLATVATLKRFGRTFHQLESGNVFRPSVVSVSLL